MKIKFTFYENQKEEKLTDFIYDLSRDFLLTINDKNKICIYNKEGN